MDRLASLKRLAAELGFAKTAAMTIAAVSVLLLVGWVAMRGTQPTGLLYAGLDPAEAGKIAQRLDEVKIPYEAKGDGTVIMVPPGDVAHIRMLLAAAGLPHQGGEGYELLDSQSPMNMTSFMQHVQRLRALEGELARTIVTLNGVQSARVHIVLPDRETFSRDTPKPTASVAVTMAGAMRLGPSQAAAIRVLVAGAVAGLQQDDVSVVDPQGIVLAANDGDALVSSRLADLKASTEQNMQRSVTGMLEPLVGFGNVRVVASVDIDTTHEVAHDEKYDPLSQVERSKQTQQDKDTSENTKPRLPVSVGQNLPNQQTNQTSDPEKSSSTSTHDGQTINYEIGSTKTERVKEPGSIKRLTVAVVVDGSVDARGNYRPRSKEELDRIKDLVQSAVGFYAKRGDTVVVDTMRFVPAPDVGVSSDAVAMAPQPVWIGAAGGGLAVLILGMIVLLMRRRKRASLRLAATEEREMMLPGAAQAAIGAALAEGPAVPGLHSPPNVLAGLYELIDARHNEAVAVIRAWIAEGESA